MCVCVCVCVHNTCMCECVFVCICMCVCGGVVCVVCVVCVVRVVCLCGVCALYVFVCICMCVFVVCVLCVVCVCLCVHACGICVVCLCVCACSVFVVWLGVFICVCVCMCVCVCAYACSTRAMYTCGYVVCKCIRSHVTLWVYSPPIPQESTTGSMTTFVTDTNADSTIGSEEGADHPDRENLNELLLREAQVRTGVLADGWLGWGVWRETEPICYQPSVSLNPLPLSLHVPPPSLPLRSNTSSS